jgi:lipoprotein-anchoring transpeptidase ErfK/SrfK
MYDGAKLDLLRARLLPLAASPNCIESESEPRNFPFDGCYHVWLGLAEMVRTRDEMRAWFLALFAVVQAWSAAQADFGDPLPWSSPRQASELSNFVQTQEAARWIAPNELNPAIGLASIAPTVTANIAAVPTAQTARGSGDLARGFEVLTPSSAYVPPRQRAASRTDAKLEGYEPGTVVVRTRERRLYLVLNEGQALRYPVAVAKPGHEWTGASYIHSKRIRPAWAPPHDIKRANPKLPDVIPGGSPSNPMGDAALLIAGGEYAIHGTNRPESIGRFVSHGCIRMYNEDILDLYQRVQVGTMVVVER